MMSGCVVHCIPTMGGGGAERQLAYLCQGLGALGWDLHVALLELGPNAARLEKSGAQIHRIRHRGNYDPQILWHLTRLMQHLAPVVVQTWVPMMDILGGLAARLAGSRFVLSERNSSPAYSGSWKDSLRCRIASQASAIVANSEAGRLYWQLQSEAHQVPKIVIGNALPLDEIDAQPPAGSEPAGGYVAGLEAHHELVLFAGRFVPAKNLALLVRALGIVLAARPQAQAILCGEGPSQDEVVGLIKKCGLEHRVILPGYVQNLWGWMKRAQVFVSASAYEGRPNTVLEAMACGCPVVVSDIAPHREILDNDSALMVPVDDAQAVASAILQVLADPAQSEVRARKARERVLNWSVDAIARQYASLYEWLVREPENRVPSSRALEA